MFHRFWRQKFMRSHDTQLITSTMMPFLPRLGCGKMFQTKLMNRFPSTAISFIGRTVLMVSTGRMYVC